MKLLMVNDATLELHSMEKEIPWADYGIDTVFTAESAAIAREILNMHKIDILLCDIEMPGEDGISLIRWIRETNIDIDCILLTCHADFAYAKEAIVLDCREYIVLPARYEDIGSTVKRIVMQRQKRLETMQLQEFGKNWVKTQQESLQVENRSQSPKETVSECEAYIQKNLSNENLNVADIAAHFYLNAIYLSRIFKKEKGVAINQWIIQKRMELAGSLLKDPSLTAISVAHRCGYANYPYFSTVFKTYYNCTPSQYLNHNE
ncbi:MAG: AraC family transcriptional regulator [Lachnospiraceae bacterium]|jgi:two-component system response regulator YesN|nr:AraC family transcriptional regulator [Lachnospiraceae bacterium]